MQTKHLLLETNSVLANGTWYKIAVQTDGIYKLTYNNLSDLGINISNLACEKIRIFGNGGGMLPKYFDLILNKKVNKNISKDYPIKWEDI